MDTSLPRISVGAISAMYMGETFEASPIPIPPTMRATINGVKLCESAVKMADIVNSTAAPMRIFLRPRRSVIAPESRAPARQPASAELIAHPESHALSAPTNPKKGS